MKAAIAKLEAGELVSGDTLNAIVASEVLSNKASGGFVLDGYPMTAEQAEFLDSIMEIREMAPLKVIYLNVPDEVALQRMKARGRADDQSTIGKERLCVFNSMIGPLVEYYGQDMVAEIDAR
jgi:adenylate kinase